MDDTAADAFQNYASPHIWRHADHSEVVVGGTGKLRGYDAKTGEELWVVTNLPVFVSPSPVTAGDLLIFGGWTTGNIPGQNSIATYFDLDAIIPEELFQDPQHFVGFFDSDKDGQIQESELPEGRGRDTFRFIDAHRSYRARMCCGLRDNASSKQSLASGVRFCSLRAIPSV